MPYSSGEAFVSKDVGYVGLSISDLVAESTGDLEAHTESRKKFYPWIYMGQSGKDLAEKLNEQSEREEILEKLKSSKLYLAYSNYGECEALTIPGTKVGEMQSAIDDRHFDTLIVGLYDLSFIIRLEEEQRFNSVLALHNQTINQFASKLNSTDRETLENEVLKLVSKANLYYDVSPVLLNS